MQIQKVQEVPAENWAFLELEVARQTKKFHQTAAVDCSSPRPTSGLAPGG